MSSGSNMPWRLLSPLIAVLWAIGTVSLAGAAGADTSTDASIDGTAAATTDGSADATHAATAAQDHRAEPARPVTGASTPTADHGGTSGDVNSPQPISNADSNSGGANGQCPDGPYCSTRDGSASANGNGDGKAVGEPCAGCVGKADNKNPRGQMPDASDANAGYECDTNHGIAKGNPAHTGCVTPSPECVPTPEVPCVPPPECVPTPEVPCVSPPECVPTPEVPCVSPPECVPTPEVPCVSPPQGGPPAPPQVSPPSSGLPNTGAPADTVWLAAAALASIVAGSSLLFWRRLRVARDPSMTG
jgi:LPXTG-motif cell wall-anchored protein